MDDNSTKDMEVIAPLKRVSNFWRTREVLLINCEIDLILTWSANYVANLQIEVQHLQQVIQNFIFQL